MGRGVSLRGRTALFDSRSPRQRRDRDLYREPDRTQRFGDAELSYVFASDGQRAVVLGWQHGPTAEEPDKQHHVRRHVGDFDP